MKNKGLMIIVSLALVAGLFGVTPAPRALAATCTSNTGTINWNTAASWSCGHVPGSAGNESDVVTIADGATVTINGSFTIASLTVGQGASGTLQFQDTTTVRTLTVTGNVTISNSGAFSVGTQSGNVQHALVIGGNLSVGNSATFNMTATSNPTSRRAKVTFDSSSVSDVTISSSGTPSLVRFMETELSRGASSRKIVCSVTAELGSGSSGVTDGVTYTYGTWEQSAGTFSFLGTNNQTLPASGNGNLTVSGSGSVSFGASVIISGGTLLVNTTGTVTVGGTGNRLEPAGGTITLTAGTVNIGGRLGSNTTPGTSNTGTLTINGATVNVPATSLSNTTTSAFAIGSSMTFQMSSGTLNILTANQGSFTGNDVDIRTGTISGGTVVLGSASPGSQDYLVRFDVPLYDLTVNASGRNVQLQTSDVTIARNLVISAGTLNANNLNITVGGDWSNSDTFTAGTGTVTFNKSGTATYGGSSTTTFNNLVVNAGTTLDVGTNTLFNANGTVTNNGTLKQIKTVNANSTGDYPQVI